MISYYAYKVLHVSGVFALLFSLGSLLMQVAHPAPESAKWKKQLSILNGVALVVVFVAGFGLMARLGLAWPWPGWIFLKALVWLFLAVATVLVKSRPASARSFWWATLSAAVVAAFFAINKPF